LQNHLIKTAPVAKPFGKNPTIVNNNWSKLQHFQNSVVKTEPQYL
jgi:hypothetical protein